MKRRGRQSTKLWIQWQSGRAGEVSRDERDKRLLSENKFLKTKAYVIFERLYIPFDYRTV
ncbi:hypothetical protein IFR09_12460 [Pseudomonas syringae]|nr:hypothetical protein [Pseudomonas syringae]MBD8792997.1 hypothetical protein [Pseudomonas syringae]MBD8803660.1 hypothetical protein [Pseudomonas syringae]MBD8811973.1 hypothetical protein [Pseudomonas syringae]